MDNLSPTSQPHLRQSYTADQKIRIVQESMRPDASIAAVAMSHRINANQLHRPVALVMVLFTIATGAHNTCRFVIQIGCLMQALSLQWAQRETAMTTP
jgi:hypothetical protein